MKLLRIVCLVLGGVLLLQVALFAVHATFSRGLTIPALPSLPPEMEAAQSGKNTNAPAGTNSVKAGTNSSSTNLLAKVATNSVGTNSLARAPKTNSSPVEISSNAAGQTNHVAKETDDTLVAAKPSETIPSTNSNTKGSNITAAADKTLTNSSTAKAAAKKNSPSSARPGAASKTADLPAPIKERIDRITQGEILAPVMRPMPMALLGIAGQSAFLRGPDGQTGLVKEGDQLGSLKLLRIGTNRVLVEQDGEKKELMIFAGLGSESLLPKPDKTTNEPPKKSP